MIDADEFAVAVEERATRISWIDCRISLDQVVERAEAHIAAYSADHASTHRLLEPKRISDCDYRLAYLHLIAVTEFHGPQPGLRNFDEGEIEVPGRTEKLPFRVGAVIQSDFDVVSVRTRL